MIKVCHGNIIKTIYLKYWQLNENRAAEIRCPGDIDSIRNQKRFTYTSVSERNVSCQKWDDRIWRYQCSSTAWMSLYQYIHPEQLKSLRCRFSLTDHQCLQSVNGLKVWNYLCKNMINACLNNVIRLYLALV